MIVGKAIYYLLTNATDVTDIVSTRVYPEIAQQDADLPYIVYAIANNEPTDTKPEPSKLDTAQVEVNIYSDSYTQAIDLAVAVRAALDRVKGTYNGVNVQSIQYLNEVIDFDEPQRAYNINADYDVRISRSGFEIAQGSPITGVQLGELSDVDVTGVTNGQLIAYNEATGNWEAANDAGGAETLDDLTDVDAGAPSSGQLLAYGQDTWETIAQDELTLPIGSVTGLQAALDAAPDNLRELTDVTISGLADNDYLQYDSASGTWQNSSLILGRNGEQYTGNYDSEAETLLDGATDTVELYYTAQADGDGLHEDAQSDTATTGYDIRRKLYYAEKAQADPDTSGDWTQFADIADDTTYASAKATLLAYLKARTGGTVPISLKMTWEEVAEGGGLLLDTYTGAAAAYSLRKLESTATNAVRVRRASDNAEQDIGFDGSGELDTTSLASFCSGTNGFVKTWYDQSGNANDATQGAAASQPKIYDSVTGVLTINGKPVMQDNNDAGIKTLTTSISTNSLHTSNEFTCVAVFQGDSNARLYFGTTSSAFPSWAPRRFSYDLAFTPSQKIGGTSLIDTQTIGFLNRSGNAVASYLNNTAAISSTDTATIATATVTDFPIAQMRYGTFVQEYVIWNSDKLTDRTDIQDNLNNFYSAY